MIGTMSSLEKRLFPAYVLCGLAAILYLPTLVPMLPTASPSYVFGYNNRAGVAILLLVVAAGAIWTKGMGLPFLGRAPSKPVPLKVLGYCLIAALAGCIAMYAFAGRFGGFGESDYDLDRLWMLSKGKTPYVDFEWPFGACFLYLPFFLRNLLSLDLVQACYLFWGLNVLLGTWLLYAIVNMIDYPTCHKTSIFILLFCPVTFLSILSMGTHTTLLRYNCPLFFILVIHRVFDRGGIGWKLFSCVLSVLFTIILLSISPETAIAFSFACTCIFLLSSPSFKAEGFLVVAAQLFALAGIFRAALKLHVLDTVMASGGGADSLPIPFAPYILLFVFSLFLCSCYIFRRFFEGRLRDNTIGLIAFSIPMVAAALGRCDPAHVISSGEAVFLVSLFYLSDRVTSWKWYKTSFVAVMIVLLPLSFLSLYRSSISRVGRKYLSESSNDSTTGSVLNYLGKKYIATFAGPARRAKWEAHLANARQFAVPERIDFSAVYPSWHGDFLAPFGYNPTGIGNYLSDQIDYGYYEGTENANTIAAVTRKISEMEDNPQRALLLADYFHVFCEADAEGARSMITTLSAFPYFGRAVHLQSVHAPMCSYILANYSLREVPEQKNFGYGLWVRKAALERQSAQ